MVPEQTCQTKEDDRQRKHVGGETARGRTIQPRRLAGTRRRGRTVDGRPWCMDRGVRLHGVVRGWISL